MLPTDHPHDGTAANFPCNALISAAFRRPSPPSNLDRAAAVASLASAADRLIRAASDAVSEHPFIKPLLSLHSDFQNFVQIRCRESRVPNSLSAHKFAAILPGDAVAGLVVANGISSFLNIYNTLLVVRLVLTWFPNTPPAIVSPLSTLCDPYLNIFRGFIPPLGGLDLSPILAFLVLNAFTSTASALPAELPSQRGIPSPHLMHSLTATQEKWIRRLCGKRSQSSDENV